MSDWTAERHAEARAVCDATLYDGPDSHAVLLHDHLDRALAEIVLLRAGRPLQPDEHCEGYEIYWDPGAWCCDGCGSPAQ